MKQVFISVAAILAVSSCALGQGQRVSVYQTDDTERGAGSVEVTDGAFGKVFSPPVQGAPYSATITNEFIQTLADGNRIDQSTTGMIARDSQGRTRQDMNLPPIGNLSVKNLPHLVFIQDPVAQVSYTLNLTNKTAEKMPMTPPDRQASPQSGNAVFVEKGDVAGGGPLPPLGAQIPVQPGVPGPARQESGGGPVIMAGPNVDAIMLKTGHGKVSTEDLGSQTMEGVYVTGVQTTRTIPAGEIGNEKPISIVTEVWTSPDLKTVVYSKRTDPRMGKQIFKLTHISRSEPDPSLFTVPADFKIIQGPQTVIYRTKD
jgi:hypothetical protein